MITKRWHNDVVAILGTGPSLKQSDVDRLKGHAKIIAVNDSWRLCPWADVLYGADRAWWQHYNYVTEFRGERWTQTKGHKAWPTEAKNAGLYIVDSTSKGELSLDPSIIVTGSNSGFQALNLAVLFGTTKILLLGIDCIMLNDQRHWFGDHPGALNRKSPYSLFRQAFLKAAPILKENRIEVINCSYLSTIACFPKMHVMDAIK